MFFSHSFTIVEKDGDDANKKKLQLARFTKTLHPCKLTTHCCKKGAISKKERIGKAYLSSIILGLLRVSKQHLGHVGRFLCILATSEMSLFLLCGSSGDVVL